MKKLVLFLVLLFAALPLAAQRPYYLDYPYKSKEKRHWFGVEASASFAADAALTVNAVFDYDVARCFSLGIGAGYTSQWNELSYMGPQFGQAFLRFKFENPAARISPLFFQDVGVGFNFYKNSYDPQWYIFTGAVTKTVLGARFRMRNGDKFNLGGCLYTHWLQDGCFPLSILFGIHCGYSF